MSSSDNPKSEGEAAEDPKPDEKENKEAEGGGFIGEVKDFINDVGDKVRIGKPTAELAAIHILKINLKKADLIIDILVTNPNPVAIPIDDINYSIESDGRKLTSGKVPDAKTIQAHGSETVNIPQTLIYNDIKNAYADVKPGTILPYKVNIDLIVDVPVIGKVTLPVEKSGELPVPYRPDVHIEKIKFEKFSFEETSAILHLKLDNKNEFDLELKRLDYEIWLCDVRIGRAEFSKTAKIVKNEVNDLDIPLNFRPKDCGSAIWDMIRGKGAGYSIKGHIRVDTPYGEMKLPIEKEGGTTTFKKNKEDGGDDIKV